MRLEDITNVLCLSCVLIFFYVSSQPRGCSPGWFGRQCKYKCRCDGTSCDVHGSCITPSICHGGWFGPACQYADLAYVTESFPALTDGNERTCSNPNAVDRITITFNESFLFTWLRVHVRDQGSGAVGSMSVTFYFNTNSVPCPVWRKYAVNKTILDIHCNLSKNINEIVLTGQAVPNLCSVYVSGGRNVALKEAASQETVYDLHVQGRNYPLDACKAVDGDTNQDLFDMSCAHTKRTNTWALTLSRPCSVHKYVIYNRSDAEIDRLAEFELECFNSTNSSVFKYKDTDIKGRLQYRLHHSPLLVQLVVVTVHNPLGIVTLCEFELYGDSACDAQHYGRDCEHVCNCLNAEACFVSTGACPSGCPGNFFGIGCMTECSPNCVPSGLPSVSSCNINTGACLKGCQSGFSGALCRNYVPDDASYLRVFMDVLLILSVLIAVFMLAICYNRIRKRRQGTEPATSNAQV